jgi:MoxR-like ATPase
MEITDLLKDFGPLIGTILFFIWRDWKREESLVNRVEKLEDFNNEVLVKMATEQASIIATNTEVVKMNTEMLDKITTVVSKCRAKQDG